MGNGYDEPMMTQVIPGSPNSMNLREQMCNVQALQVVGSFVSDGSEKSQTDKPSPPSSTDGNSAPPSSTDGNSGQKKRQLKSRKRPDREMRNRCKMVADWIEVMGPSAFTSIVGCDKEYLRALLQDKVNLTNTILDKK